MRTQEEIVNQIESVIKDDFLGFEYPIYLDYLDYEHAKPYINDDITKDEWSEIVAKVSDPKTEMIEYMEFAWRKANNCRGISASRSISHYKAWLWLDGNDELANCIEDEYEFYGKPQLVKICQYLGIDSSLYDDGIRTNT